MAYGAASMAALAAAAARAAQELMVAAARAAKSASALLPAHGEATSSVRSRSSVASDQSPRGRRRRRRWRRDSLALASPRGPQALTPPMMQMTLAVVVGPRSRKELVGVVDKFGYALLSSPRWHLPGNLLLRPRLQCPLRRVKRSGREGRFRHPRSLVSSSSGNRAGGACHIGSRRGDSTFFAVIVVRTGFRYV